MNKSWKFDWLLNFKDGVLHKEYMEYFDINFTSRSKLIYGSLVPLWIGSIFMRCYTYNHICYELAAGFLTNISFAVIVLLQLFVFKFEGKYKYHIMGVLPFIFSVILLHQDVLIDCNRMNEPQILIILVITNIINHTIPVSIVQCLFLVVSLLLVEYVRGRDLLHLAIHLFIMVFNTFVMGYMAQYISRMTFFYFKQAESKSALLQQKKSDLRFLLYRLLPERVANQLLMNRKQVTEMHVKSTVIFIGLNEFNEDDLVDLVDDEKKKDLFAFLEWMFTLIDRKADEYGIEKIKTTSATWLGIVKSGSDQQTRATTFALAVMDMMKKERATVPVTCGISDGPVIGCVLGKLKPVYDVISDTVNTTHRLYTNGPVNGVCVTKEFSDKLSDLHDYIKVEEKGEVKLKGMGVKDLVFISMKSFDSLCRSPSIKKLHIDLAKERQFEMDEDLIWYDEVVKDKEKLNISYSEVIVYVFSKFYYEYLALYGTQLFFSEMYAVLDYIFFVRPNSFPIHGPIFEIVVANLIFGCEYFICLRKKKRTSAVAYLMCLSIAISIETKRKFDEETMEFFTPKLFYLIFQFSLVPVGLPMSINALFIFSGYIFMVFNLKIADSQDLLGMLFTASLLTILGSWGQNADIIGIVKHAKAIKEINVEIEERKTSYEGALDSLIPKSLRSLLTHKKNFVTFHTCVMFADVVEFTEYSAKAGPGKTVRLLDEVFECIDGICVRRNMSRFKLIGDAYVACGIEGVGDNTCRNAYEASQEIMRDTQVIMERYRGIHDGLNLRIGLAEGVVSAGLIGREASRTVYDIYGGCIGEAEQCQKAALPGEIFANSANLRTHT